MQLFNISHLPTAIGITLYKYNYVDNKIWTQIHNEVDYITYDEDSIMVSKNQIEYIIEKYYRRTLNKIKTLGTEVIHKEINTVYFLEKILSEMNNLKYIKIDLNLDKSYDRIIADDSGSKLLQFSFKVLSATLYLTDLYDDIELAQVNKLLEEVGVFKQNSPFARIRANDLAEIIDFCMLASNDKDGQETGTEVLIDILEVLQQKLEHENSLILLITDY